jgi:quinol monooxygenase YgiN
MPRELYGLHGTIRAKPSQRDALLAILLDAANDAHSMPGCRLYVVSLVPDDADAIAVTEIWDDKASHDASLALETVRATVARAGPLIAGMGTSSDFRPVGGLGL